jgi:hypothetical protein
VGVAVGVAVGVGVGMPVSPHFVPAGIVPLTASSHNPLLSTTKSKLPPLLPRNVTPRMSLSAAVHRPALG